MALNGKSILITGAGRRIGRHLAIFLAGAGADIVIHFGNSIAEAQSLALEIENLGRKAWLLQADLNDAQAAAGIISRANQMTSLFAVINNASIFEPLSLANTSLTDWQHHLNVNLTAPFLISQAFAATLPPGSSGRIINLLDWRALRPSGDHFPYTISKAALAALTRSLAAALAPSITVNGIALGAILAPSDGRDTSALLASIPARRWADLDEVAQTVLFLLDGPDYITGEIIHLDGGRHLI
jgi:pteridine reductase